MMNKRRRKYLIDKSFQTEFIIKFCGLVALGCLILGIGLYLFSSRTVTTSFDNSRLVVRSTADYLLPGLLFGSLIVGFLMAVFAGLMVLFMTHRVVGPIYRFEKYAEQIGAGELSEKLKIRKKDQFQSMVGTLNKMVNDLGLGLMKVMEVSDKLDGLIDKLSERANGEILLKEDIKAVVSELKTDKQHLNKALSYFRVRQ